jgi:hypothetical protein
LGFWSFWPHPILFGSGWDVAFFVALLQPSCADESWGVKAGTPSKSKTSAVRKISS